MAAWDAAVDGRRALGRPFELARALADLAAISFRARRRDEGAAALAEAHVIAVELGARPLREAIESLARRARIGLEGVDTAEDAADRLGLTPREREVLALLADGRSNRQIGDKLFMAESTAGRARQQHPRQAGRDATERSGRGRPSPRALPAQLTAPPTLGTCAARRSTTSRTSSSVL